MSPPQEHGILQDVLPARAHTKEHGYQNARDQQTDPKPGKDPENAISEIGQERQTLPASGQKKTTQNKKDIHRHSGARYLLIGQTHQERIAVAREWMGVTDNNCQRASESDGANIIQVGVVGLSQRFAIKPAEFHLALNAPKDLFTALMLGRFHATLLSSPHKQESFVRGGAEQ